MLDADSTTPTAGVADNPKTTALDSFANTATAYTGSHTLTFGGAANSANATHPTFFSSAGTPTNCYRDSTTAFSSAVPTVSGANNGVMKLAKAETASITVSDGS